MSGGVWKQESSKIKNMNTHNYFIRDGVNQAWNMNL